MIHTEGTDTREPLVEMRGISKVFPGNKALDKVDLRLYAGEVHVLFGENGAGKSTLISILSGVRSPTEGTIVIASQPVRFHGVQDAAAAGVGVVFQEFSLVPTLRVFENVYLGDEIIRGMRGPFIARKRMKARAQELFDRLGFAIDVGRKAAELSRAEQQMVEIAKAFHKDVDILIFDEPTASLTEKETQMLFSFIKEARNRGVAIVYVSHRIQEFSEIADRITVLSDGRRIGTIPASEMSEKKLLTMMVGREIDTIYPTIDSQVSDTPLLSLKGVHTGDISGVNVDVRAGEILGIAGLAGSGKSRLWRAVVGLQPISAGRVILEGDDVANVATRRLLDLGLYYLPPDRKAEGLHLTADGRRNIALNALASPETVSRFGLIQRGGLWKRTSHAGRRAGVPDIMMGRTVAWLSGGNQQKVLFAKGLAVERKVYIFDEPTVGVDVASRAALYLLIKSIVEEGGAVVLISSDLPEVMNLSHRLVVFAGGRVSAKLSKEQLSEHNILKHFFEKNEER